MLSYQLPSSIHSVSLRVLTLIHFSLIQFCFIDRSDTAFSRLGRKKISARRVLLRLSLYKF